MIEIGQYSELRILRATSVGLYLGDEDGEDVLLPNKYCPEEFEIDDLIKVFVYLDYDERKIATNIIPKIHLKEFALLECTAVSEYGAFMDWGMEKNLLVPFKEQRQNMIVGRWYVVYMDLDEKTDRLFASNKIDKKLDNEMMSVEEGEEVDLMVYHQTKIGFSVIVNNKHKGLVYKNEVFKDLNIGDKLKGYVKTVREENKLDISLQPIGFLNFNSKNSEDIYKALVANDGYIGLTDKSSPDQIYVRFGISKKAFKRAVGDLYKQRKIVIEDKGIRITSR